MRSEEEEETKGQEEKEEVVFSSSIKYLARQSRDGKLSVRSSWRVYLPRFASTSGSKQQSLTHNRTWPSAAHAARGRKPGANTAKRPPPTLPLIVVPPAPAPPPTPASQLPAACCCAEAPRRRASRGATRRDIAGEDIAVASFTFCPFVRKRERGEVGRERERNVSQPTSSLSKKIKKESVLVISFEPASRDALARPRYDHPPAGPDALFSLKRRLSQRP